MKILVLLIMLLTIPRLEAGSLPEFIWDATAEAEGLSIQGNLAWNQKACDFDKVEQDTRTFPVFSYKRPSGKPYKDPTGAFCFALRLPEERLGTLLHFSMIRLFGVAELTINGERVWFQDQTTGAERLNLLYEVKSQNLLVELRLRCHEAPSCGFRGALHVRSDRQGTRADLLHYSYDLLALTGILACLFYHMIFAFLRRRSSTAIFLSINAFALMLRLFLSGHGQLHFFFNIPENWYWRLETLAAYLLLASTVSLVRTVFENEAPKHLSLLGWSIAGTSSVFLLLGPRVFPFLLSIVYALVFLNIINYMFVIPRALRQRRSGAVLMVICAAVTFFSALFEALNTRWNIEMHSAAQPLTYLGTMIFQSVLLATRINDAFVTAEKQESEIKTLKEQIEVEIRSLDQKILERTTELRTIFQSISTGILWINLDDQNSLRISSEYSDHLRQTIGFDIEAWHEMHFFLRRMRLSPLPCSGKELAAFFQEHMKQPETLDPMLEKLLGGIKVFDDLDRAKHLKFKWIPILEDGRVTELFLFVFDVSLSMDMQELAHCKALEIEALRELTRLSPVALEAGYQVFGNPSLPTISQFAAEHQLVRLDEALSGLQHEKHLDKFMQAYQRVLTLLAERQIRARQQSPFDYESFLEMPDWENLPVDTRTLFHELVRARGK
ncbi:MAG TPA: 7TM-DISM domain-containing protein [Oligoflexus sp.]|uniref:7TM-DISM domain-containing protein n=1 Tax=Oligoflexus sp. TaxID=1971216 RepID=UPI002D80D428|nr:7TM-DISM domain-containing protein [Oligoflexus sp.]HET9235760.1 7TM-DISM domain-containing protein [Oligoflexus sp.]